MKRFGWLAVIALLSGCSLFGSGTGAVSTSSPSALPSPSPTAFVQGLWVLSPLGIRIHEQADVNSKVVSVVPQGENLTAKDFKATGPGWYLVTYQGAQGWIAATVPDSSPKVPLVTTHPQLSYSSTAAGYYFLYPSSWIATDKALDAEVDAPVPGAPGGPSLAPSAQPTNANGPIQSDRLSVHEAKDLASLGATPVRARALADTATVEVYGITTLRRLYTLAAGGIEVEVRFKIASDRAVLLDFLGVAQKDLDTFNDIMYSFGVNLPGASPAPSP